MCYVRSLGFRRNVDIIFHEIETFAVRNIDCAIYQSEHMPTNVSTLSPSRPQGLSFNATKNMLYDIYKPSCLILED